MIGIVLIAHKPLGQSFIEALEHIMGPQNNIVAVDIADEDTVDQSRDNLIVAIETVDSTDGVVIVSDMFGGTPSNLAISMLSHDNIEVLAGMNLPMLVKLVESRKTKPLAEAAHEAQAAGREYINVASEFLKASAA